MKTIFYTPSEVKIPLFITFVGNVQTPVYLDIAGYYYITLVDLPEFKTGENAYIQKDDVYMFTGQFDENKNPIYTGHEIDYGSLSEIWEDGKLSGEYERFTGVVIMTDTGTFTIVNKEHLIDFNNTKQTSIYATPEANRQWKDGTHDWYSIENLEIWNSKILSHIAL